YPTQPQIVPFVDYALSVSRYESARFRLASGQNSTAVSTPVLSLVKPTLPSMVYPSAKEKARLNALANDDTPSPNSNQPINNLLLRQIARPWSKMKTPSTNTVDNCNTPPPGPSRTIIDSPQRPIARPRRKKNDLPPTPDSDIYPFN
ncbi:13162_t:CDS:1, partial [Rhizophagus irregularis]